MSDHFSGPAVMDDPSADLTDFYAFPSPERPGNLVLIANVFPMATARSFFSDVVTYRFRLRPLACSGGKIAYGTSEHTIDVKFNELHAATPLQGGTVVTTDGRKTTVVLGKATEQNGLRVFAGLVSDPFFMDVEAAIRTDMLGRLAFNPKGTNTVQFRDVMSIVVEIPIAPLVERFDDVTLVGAIAETVIARRGSPLRIERVGRPEIKNFVLQSPAHDARTRGIELRDLYNREDAFALSKDYRALYESRIDANLAFFDALDGKTAWPLQADGRHPLRDMFLGDFLILDLAYPFAGANFLEIERSLLDKRPHQSPGGRWLDDDILDELLTLMVNGARGERFGDGVDAPTKPGSLIFPYVREPNKRTDLPVPAFVES